MDIASDRFPRSATLSTILTRILARRNVIEDAPDGQDLVLPVRRLADDGLKAWRQVLEHGYEGLVAKDDASPYVGGRTLKWLR